MADDAAVDPNVSIAPVLNRAPSPSAGSTSMNHTSVSPSTTTTTTNSVPALATTKRKFHKLLDSITNSSLKRSTTSSFSPFSGVDSPAKRIRLEARSRLEVSAPNLPTYENEAARSKAKARALVQTQLLKTKLEAARSTSSLSSLRSRTSREGDTGEAATPLKEPNYNPWSHTGFLRRLKTFSNVRLWSAKPDNVNEVAWAKRGWVCVAWNTVACKGGCEERLVVGLRPAKKDDEGKDIDGTEDMSVDVPDELIKRYEEFIDNAHDEDCLWRSRGGCKDDIYRLSIARQSIWQPELRDRYLSFLPSMSTLTFASNIINPIDANQLSHCLPADFLTPSHPSGVLPSTNSDPPPLPPDAEPQPQLNITALSFALTGWSLSPESTLTHTIMTCSTCFRRVGLWLYTQPSHQQPPAQSLSQSQSQPSSQDPSMNLNLSTQHRSYCPWISASSQHMTGSLSGRCGYEVLARCIESAARFRGVTVGTSQMSKESTETNTGRNSTDETPSENGELVLGEGESRLDEMKSNSTKSKEDQEKEDKARFAKLRELAKGIGLPRLRMTLASRRYN